MDFEGFQTERMRVFRQRPEAPRPEGLAGILTPGVLAPLPPSLALPPGGAADWLTDRQADSAVFSVVPVRGGALIGLLLIAPQEGTPPVWHIGYLLGEASWGQGLASELIAGLVRALEAGPERLLVGGVAEDNPASARVLAKAMFEPAPAEDGMILYRRRVGQAA